jgi:hypothetical protein
MEACALPASLAPGAEERMWSRISGRREWQASVRGVAPFEPRARSRFGALAGVAAPFMVVCMVVGGWMLVDGPRSGLTYDGAYDGIKGASAPVSARLIGLRYATVDAEGKLHPGTEVAEVKVGTPLVFAVEAEGVDPQVGHRATLAYTVESQGSRSERRQITEHQLKSDRETIRDDGRVVAFTPELPGAYVFILSGDSNADTVSFSVQVVAP